MVGGATARVAGARRRGGGADDRNGPPGRARGARGEKWTALVRVAVQDRFGAETADDRLERARVGQAAQRRAAARKRGMMN